VTILTERIPLASLLSGKDALKRLTSLAGRIRDGAVFIYPTETIYGIGGIATSKNVEKRLFLIKQRPEKSPLLLLASNVDQFQPFGLIFSENATLLAKKFWPGNLTLVVPAKIRPQGVGVRVSDHPFVKSILPELGVPVFSTSANISDRPYVNDPDAIFRLFDGVVDFMVDGGTLPESKPSTVVKISGNDSVELLREGIVSNEQIVMALMNKGTAAGR
jgi:L-threonylcarbamoyladenylate synthase